MNTLDINQYTSVPLTDVPSSVTLTVTLLTAMPPDASEPVHEAANRMQSSLEALKVGWAAREARNKDRRPADIDLGRAWRALHDTMNAAQTLSHGPRRDAGKQVYATLFTSGLGFTKAVYERQWAESSRLLELIDSQGLQQTVELAAGGPEPLEQLREAHQVFGQALRVTEADMAEEVNLRERLSELRAAIVSYAINVIAWTTADSSRVPVAQMALRPIDRARALEARRSNGQAADEVDREVDGAVDGEVDGEVDGSGDGQVEVDVEATPDNDVAEAGKEALALGSDDTLEGPPNSNAA